jgi:hypothetical protein
MTNSAEAVWFDEGRMRVALADGRRLSVPLAWFPRLMRATAEAREAVEISAYGLHWEALDEDISVAGLLVGRVAPVSEPIEACEHAPCACYGDWRAGLVRGRG